jgi:hypothetical protein
MESALGSRKSCSRITTFTLSCACRTGCFAPCTGIPTNVLFFDRSGPTRDVWYYEQPLPEGRKNYTKTQPIQFDEFRECIAWWKDALLPSILDKAFRGDL